MFYEMHKHKNHFILASFTHHHLVPNLYDLLSSVEFQMIKMKMWFSSIIKVRMLRLN